MLSMHSGKNNCTGVGLWLGDQRRDVSEKDAKEQMMREDRGFQAVEVDAVNDMGTGCISRLGLGGSLAGLW